ncbi:hypothetical protein B0H14DRAFT_2583164 [Mycena olivaceomarginata]|nr:hypothetical protein B0H14DRAFT_2583164 [Mycena olivaceomarginata]
MTTCLLQSCSLLLDLTDDCSLTTQTQAHGIVSAAEVDTSKENAFTTKWCIAPNLVPIGLRDSSTEVDSGAIMPSPTAAGGQADPQSESGEDYNESLNPPIAWSVSPGYTPEPRGRKRGFSDRDSIDSGDDYKTSSSVPSESRPVYEELQDDVEEQVEEEEIVVEKEEEEEMIAEEEEEEMVGWEDEVKVGDDEETEVLQEKPKKVPSRKNPPKANKSDPATAVAFPKPAKKTKLAEFGEIAKIEEKTQQKELELAAMRTRQVMKVVEVKGRLGEKREERKMEKQHAENKKDMVKLRMKELKMRNPHEVTWHPSSYSRSEPIDYRDVYDRFTGHVTPSFPDNDSDFNFEFGDLNFLPRGYSPDHHYFILSAVNVL